MIYRTNETKLLSSFAAIMNKKEEKRTFIKGLAFAINYIQPFTNVKNYPIFVTYEKIFEILDFFYNRSYIKKILKLPKYRFYRIFFKLMVRKKFLKKVDINTISDNSNDDIFILPISKGFLLLTKKNIKKLSKCILYK